MPKDQYSGYIRVKSSNLRRTSRTRGDGDRVIAPSYRSLPASPAGTTPAKDADDALSGALIQAGVLTPSGARATSTIRDYVAKNTGTLFNHIKRQGESDTDAGNAIRARLGRRLVPDSFTLKNPLKGKSGLGTMSRGAPVKVAAVKVEGGVLKWNVKGQTPNGRHISNDVDDETIGRLF